MLVTQAHFGSNIMYGGHSTAAGSPLERFSDWVGATNFRYPGGTVTERLSHKDGTLDAIFEQGNGDLINLTQALEFAESRGGDITFVLPTHTFLTDGEFGERSVDEGALAEFLVVVSDMLAGKYGPPVIRTFEIGNEWWYLDERMTAEEYGVIANAYAKGLGAVLEIHKDTLEDPSEWIQPNIAVQTGAYWRGPESNTAIIDSLDDDAKEHINMVIAHFYPRNLGQAEGNSSRWNAIQEFLDDDGFGDLKVLISEWNISRHAELYGMEQASLLTETFKTMIKKGVDEANIWGTNYKNLSTKLAQMSHNHNEGVDPEDIELHLTPTGEVYRMMAQNLVGKQLLDVDVEKFILNLDENLNGDLILMQAYGSPEQLTIFISNIGDNPLEFNINERFIPDDFSHVWAQYMTAHDDPRTNVDEGDPSSIHARGLVTTRNEEQLHNAGGKIELGAKDLIKITYTLDGVGVSMRGTDQLIDPDLFLSDHLVGGHGNDKIFGNLGDDFIEGISGHNILSGGDGNDTVFGGVGNDLIFGGVGNNHLQDDDGSNIFVSTGQLDFLQGGKENDLFHVSGDKAIITGNGGMNLYHFEGQGSHTITDFNPENGDLLSFGGLFKDDMHFVLSLSAMQDEVGESFNILIKDEFSDLEVELIGLGDMLPEIEEYILDFMSTAERAEELSYYFNQMNEDQFSEFICHVDVSKDVSIFQNISGDDIYKFFDPKLSFVLVTKIDPDFQHPLNYSDENMENTADTSVGDSFWEDFISDDVSLDGLDDKNIDSTSSSFEDSSQLHESDESRNDTIEDQDDSERDYRSSDGTCFVATAAFRDPLHPDVVFLRSFRDGYLKQRRFGRAFVSVYWIVGPVLAIPVRKNDFLAALSKSLIKSVVKIIKIFWR